MRTQLTEGLPRVQGDRVQLQQVLLNLIINAIEAMRDVGEEERELLISTRNEPDGVSVEVRIQVQASQRRILTACSRLSPTKPSGLGLGLSICRSIIEAHNGQLRASPNVPRGAIFGFIAPAHPAGRIVSGVRLRMPRRSRRRSGRRTMGGDPARKKGEEAENVRGHNSCVWSAYKSGKPWRTARPPSSPTPMPTISGTALQFCP